jgi:hypothetical protein
MTETNPQRGDVAVTLGGLKFNLRPSFAAIAAIEAATGQGILALSRAFFDDRLKLTDAAIVVAAAARAGGRAKVADARMGELLHAAGFFASAELVGAVAQLLNAMISGGVGGTAAGNGGGGAEEDPTAGGGSASSPSA